MLYINDVSVYIQCISLLQFQLHMARMLPGFTLSVLITSDGLSFINTKQ